MGSQFFLKSFTTISIILLLSLPASWSNELKNQSEIFELGSHSTDIVEPRVAPLVAFGVVSNVIGIAGTLLTAFGMGWSFGTAPKATTDDIMKDLAKNFGQLNAKIDSQFEILDSKIANLASDVSSLRNDIISGFNAMDSQFAVIRTELQTIYNTMLQLELGQYSNVEIAIKGALRDMRYNSSLDLMKRATNLCDQLDFFMGGLMGTNSFGSDLLSIAVTQTQCSVNHVIEKVNTPGNSDCLKNKTILAQCAISSLTEKMNKYYSLMGLGFMGLGYYSKLIGPSFNGPARLADYLSQKKVLIQRIESARQACIQLQIPFILAQNTINGLVSQYNLIQDRSISTPGDVSNVFYAYFDNFFLQNTSLNWLVYVVPGTRVNPPGYPYGSPAILYANYIRGGLLNGQATNGNWTIFWAVQNGLPKNTLTVNEKNLASFISHEAWVGYWMSTDHTYSIGNAINTGYETVTGRNPSFVLVFTFFNFPNSASLGNPIRGKNSTTISQPATGTTNLTNVYYSRRFTDTIMSGYVNDPDYPDQMDFIVDVVIQ